MEKLMKRMDSTVPGSDSTRHKRRSSSRWIPVFLAIFVSTMALGCGNSVETTQEEKEEVVEGVKGCDGQVYPASETSPYVLPYPVGKAYTTGLTNCSSSFHGAGQPDQYAFDFDMLEGTPFTAARGGIVFQVVELAPSFGGGSGNFVVVDHGDNTFGMYLHSPQHGISVEPGDRVERGDTLGVAGLSGLAGYPHLHFIVVTDSPEWPYNGIPISFSNASPADHVLKGQTTYTALPY